MRMFAASLFLAFVAACGQTGDLYLPSQTPPSSQQSPEDKVKKKEQPLAPEQPAPAPQPN
jgi:predicted small lipoprotein YifL